MKTYFYKLLIFFLCFFITNLKIHAYVQPELLANIELNLKNFKQNSHYKLEFEMYSEVNLNYTLQKKIYNFKIDNNTTQIDLPITDSLNYGRIKLYIDNKLYRFNNENNLYLFAPNDQIKITIDDKNVSFLGRGSDKYICLYELYQLNRRLSEQEQQAYLKKDYETMFLASFSAIEIEAKQKQKIIDSFKQIEPLAKILIEVDIWSQMLRKMYGSLYAKTLMPDSYKVFNESIGVMLKKYEYQLDERRFNDELLVKSFYYVSYLYDLNVLRCIYSNSNEINGYNFRFSFSDLSKQIELNNYPDLIRSKLYLLAFYRNYSQSHDTLSGISNITNTLGNNIFKQSIISFYDHIYKSIYDFTLKDKRGRDISLNNFKGKLLVLDFWFTGCRGCKLLAKELDPIVTSYKNSDKISFISVCIDKSKKSWLKSVKTGEYTSRNSINLYTGGLRYEHPLIKNFNILSYPTILIISKEGKLITAAPPRLIKDNSESIKEFTKMINLYL